MATRPRPIYVAVDGSDGQGNGTSRKPWATVERALAFIAARGFNSTERQTADQYVYCGPGTYWRTEIVNGPIRSGANGFDVVVAPLDGVPGSAILAGGRVIDPASWVNVSGDVYKTPLTAPVYTMWENGTRGRSARLPKLAPGAGFEAAFAPYFFAWGVDDSYDELQINHATQFDPAGWSLADTRLFVWSTLFGNEIDWFTDDAQVTAFDDGTDRYTIGNDGVKFLTMSGPSGARFFVHGPLELLTEDGEFVCRQDGGEWFLYYQAVDGPIDEQEIVIPTTDRVVSFVGDDENTRVSHIRFDEMGVAYSNFSAFYRFGEVRALNTIPAEYETYQAQLDVARKGLVYIENADHITVDRTHLQKSGMAGVFLRGYVQDCAITNNLIEDIASTGIFGEGRAPGDGDVFKNNTYDNNIGRRFGQMVGDGVGIRLQQSGGNTISHGDYSVGPRQAIVLTGWDDIADADMYTVDNQLDHLRLTDVGQDSGDMGAITLEFFNNFGVQTVDQVIIDGVTAHASMSDTIPNGVFCDNQTGEDAGTGQLLSNIQVSNTQGDQFRTNDSTGHQLTNCSFLSDGSVNPDFNPALMDDDIGVTAENPYA